MTKKSFVALATLLCGAAAFATPGAYTQWFANAVTDPLVKGNPGWSDSAALGDGAVAVTTDAAVTYTATAPATAYAKQTVTVTSEPLDELPATNDDSLADARFAFGVAQLEGDDDPAVYVLSKVDGVAKWTKTSITATAGATTAVEVTYDKVAKTFTVTDDSTVFTSLIDESTDWTTTSFVGNGSVNALSGEKAGAAAASYNGQGYDTVAAAIAAAEADEYAHGKVVLESDYQITTAGSHKLDPNGHNVTTADGLYLGAYSAADGYTVYDAAARALAPNICLSYLNGTAVQKVFDGVCVADIVDGGFSVAARVSGGYVTSTVRGTRGTVVAGDVVRENGVATSAKFLYYIADAANGYQFKGVLVTFTNGAEGLYAKVEKVGQIDNATGDVIAKMTSGTIADGNKANGYTVTQLQLKKGEEYLGGLAGEYDFDVANGVDRWGTLTTTANFGVSDGKMIIDEGETVSLSYLRLNNTADTTDSATLDIAGTVDIQATASSVGVYAINPKVGVLMGHYKGSSTINVSDTGTLNVPNAFISLGYTANGGTLNIDGGTVKTRSLLTRDSYYDKTGTLTLTNGGHLELDYWANDTQGTLNTTLGYGTIASYRYSDTAWTTGRTLNFTDAENGTTLDATVKPMAFTGAFTGDGKVIVKGAVDLSAATVFADGEGSVEVAADGVVTLKVTAEQFAAGEEVTFEKVAVVSGATVKIVDATGVLLETTVATEAGQATWSGSYGENYDETGVQPQHWYKFNDPSALTTSSGVAAFPINGDAATSQPGALGEGTAANVPWWTNNEGLTLGDGDWSVAIVAKISATANGVLWNLGGNGRTSNGFALLKSATGIAVKTWGSGAGITGLDIPVVDATTAFHVYTLTYEKASKTYTLTVDGVKAKSVVSDFVAPARYYQFSGVHGGNPTGFANGNDSVFDDFRIYRSAIDAEKQAKISTAFRTKYIVAKIGEEPYYTLTAALDAVTEAQVVDICDDTAELPGGYTDGYVLEGTQAWKKRNVYLTAAGTLILSDAAGATAATLRQGDTVVLDRASNHLSGSVWGGGKDITGYVGYPVVVAAEMDLGTKTAGKGIPANSTLTVNYGEVVSGTRKGVYLYRDIGAGARVDGSGALYVGFENVTQIGDGVIISCDTFGFQSINKHIEIAANATVTIDSVNVPATGNAAAASGNQIRLNEGSILKTKQVFADNVVVVNNGITGKRVATATEGEYTVYTLEAIPPTPGVITVAQGDSAQEVVVTVPVSNAEGQTVTLVVKDKDGTTLPGTHTGTVTGGQAVITITGAVDTGYTFEAAIGGTSLGEGTFFTGIDNVWFAASAVSGVSAVTNGAWNVTPAIDGRKYVINDPEGNRFVVDSAKQGEGDGKLAKIVQVVTFTSAIEVADLPAIEPGTVGGLTVAQDGANLVWKGVKNGAWATLEGATPPALDTEYTVTVEYDRRGEDGVFTYKVGETTLGVNTVAKTTGFSGVTAMGTGKLASIEATAGAAVPVAEGYVTSGGDPIRVDNDSAAVFGANREAVQAELLKTPVTGGLKVWEAYALGATAKQAQDGVVPVISGAQTSDTDKMKIVDGFTVREHTGIAVTRTVKTKTTADGEWSTDGDAEQNADGVKVALPAEGAKAKYIKIEYTFQ